MNLFKTSIQRHVEKKEKTQNEIEVLKTQQKVEYETKVSEYKTKKTKCENDTDAQISAHKNIIENLKATREAQLTAYDKELTVELKKIDNEFDAKILAKMNEVKKLNNLIEKEQKDIADLVQPTRSNAPKDNRKILNENK